MRFSSKTFRRKSRTFKKRTKPTKQSSKKSRKVRRYSQKGGANTFDRKIPKYAVLANPMQVDDKLYEDLNIDEEELSNIMG